ncbi:MAG TPA: alpha/beta fold hydrolase, partial [Thermodesulfobacteriota bacterium]|nr:alpha/beta fold hydrolase [Thermodesulfobacteriota bacterium]
MAFAAVGALSVHYDEQGPPGAPPLLLLHSLGTSLHIWDPVVPALARLYRVVRCDLRGHGLTAGGIDPADPATTVDELAGDALGLLDALSIERAAVCGLSIGGMVALRMAARAPGRIEWLALCGTGYRIGTPQSWAERAAAVAREGLAALADALVARWVTPEFLAQRPAEVRGLTTMLVRTPADGYIAGCRALGAADLEADARALRTPAL